MERKPARGSNEYSAMFGTNTMALLSRVSRLLRETEKSEGQNQVCRVSLKDLKRLHVMGGYSESQIKIWSDLEREGVKDFACSTTYLRGLLKQIKQSSAIKAAYKAGKMEVARAKLRQRHFENFKRKQAEKRERE